MRLRFLIGALVVAGLAGIYVLDRNVFGAPLASRLLLWFVALGALREVLGLAGRRVECGPGLFFYGGVATIAVVVPSLVAAQPVPGSLLALAAAAGGAVRFLGMARVRSAPVAFPEAVLLAAAMLYTGGLLSFLDRVLLLDLETGFAVLIVSKSNDIAGYVVGTLFGRRRIAPAISPKKTWEGTVAGLLAAAGVAALLAPHLAGPPAFAAAIGALLGGTSLMGDLVASGLKRWAGVKDSARLLPEYGGYLDMLDGILLAAPVAVVCLHGS